MLSCFASLRQKAVHYRDLQLIDTRISFYSSNVELVDFTVGELEPLLPQATAENEKIFTCVVENTQTVRSQFPDIFADILKTERKDIHSPELGKAGLYLFGSELTIIVDNVGTFCHSGTGHFLILVDSNTLATDEGNKLNIQMLLNLLVSEVLLLSDKFLVHAGCVGSGGECQIWTGESGAGKTTQTLNMVSRGYDFYGDDQIIIGPGEDEQWYAWPFWRVLKVSPDSVKYFSNLPLVDEDFSATDDKKVINNIQQALSTEKPPPARIGAINLIIPHGEKILQELSLDEAFQQVAPGFLHSILPTTVMQKMDKIIDLLSDVPVTAVSWDMLDKLGHN